MKKHKIMLFGAILYILAIGNLLSPNRVFSPNENRLLKQMPEISMNSIFSGEFGKNFEEFASDQFIFRDRWIGLKTRGDLALGKRDNGRIFFGRENYLFDMSDGIDKTRLNRNITSINIFLENLKNNGLEASFLLVPSKSTVIFDRLPLFAPVLDENIIIDILRKDLSSNANILELSDKLKEKRRNYIYFRTDHHWTTNGAYYSYVLLMNHLEKTPLKEDDFKIETVSKDFLGSNYRMANFFRGNPDNIDILIPKNNVDIEMVINNNEIRHSLYDESFLDTRDQYSFFLGGDNALVEIESSVGNGESILIIKDSFANSFVPLLTNHYENITMIDTRFFNESIIDFVNKGEFDDILFLINVENYHNERTLFRLSR